jgi:hypothetical protein
MRAGPAARILSPSWNATNSATRATRREAGVTGVDCGASAVVLRALPTGPVASSECVRTLAVRALFPSREPEMDGKV